LTPPTTSSALREPNTGFLLLDAKVIPYLPEPSLENYARLVEGVILYPYQLGLFLLAGLALLGVGGIGLLRRLLPEEEWMGFWQGRLLLLMALSLFALALSLSPKQFTGQGTETKFLLWVRNTFLISGLTGLLAVLLTATAGYAFARFRHLPGRYPLLLFFIFVQMFPGFLALVAIYYLLSRLDLLNTFTGLVLAYSGGIISFGTWVYKGYLESISPSLEEAAMVDGATKWQVFTKILLPLSAPMFVFIFLLQFVGTYSEFVLANLVLTGVESWNVGVGLRSFTTGQFQTKWGVFAAASVLGSLPILFLFYGFQQYFVSGYTAGAVKE
jgi:arabinogalactan oligomer/maltooligosaccharide transport system permease protein